MGPGLSSDDVDLQRSSQLEAETNGERRGSVDGEYELLQLQSGSRHSLEQRNMLITEATILRMNNTPTHHVVGKLSSFSGEKKAEALHYFLEHAEEIQNGKDIAELDTSIPYPNIFQALLEYQIFFEKATGRVSQPFHVIRCNGLEPVDSPGNRAWKLHFQQLSPVSQCYYVMGENILGMRVRLLETHNEVGRQAMCYIGYVNKNLAIDGGMNRWPISRSYHTVRMRPVIDGSHHRVRHETWLLYMARRHLRPRSAYSH